MQVDFSDTLTIFLFVISTLLTMVTSTCAYILVRLVRRVDNHEERLNIKGKKIAVLETQMQVYERIHQEYKESLERIVDSFLTHLNK